VSSAGAWRLPALAVDIELGPTSDRRATVSQSFVGGRTMNNPSRMLTGRRCPALPNGRRIDLVAALGDLLRWR
jgi:hypothetical protein